MITILVLLFVLALVFMVGRALAIPDMLLIIVCLLVVLGGLGSMHAGYLPGRMW